MKTISINKVIREIEKEIGIVIPTDILPASRTIRQHNYNKGLWKALQIIKDNIKEVKLYSSIIEEKEKQRIKNKLWTDIMNKIALDQELDRINEL